MNTFIIVLPCFGVVGVCGFLLLWNRISLLETRLKNMHELADIRSKIVEAHADHLSAHDKNLALINKTLFPMNRPTPEQITAEEGLTE